jgi:carbon-monoxide dehydrogenase small subunit
MTGPRATVPVAVRVNGEDYDLQVHPGLTLLDLLRDELALTGAKRGCESGACGACTVLLDGDNVKSCLMLAFQARGSEITTIEGCAAGPNVLHPIQEAFVEHGGLQCGYCSPGFVLSTKALLDRNPSPTEEEIRAGLTGNLCRCTGYVGIVRAVQSAAADLATPRP